MKCAPIPITWSIRNAKKAPFPKKRMRDQPVARFSHRTINRTTRHTPPGAMEHSHIRMCPDNVVIGVRFLQDCRTKSIRAFSFLQVVGNIYHTWELGSGTAFVSLLPAIIKSQHPSSVILVLDLTSSELIVETAETLLNTLTSLITHSSKNEDKSSNESFQVYKPIN